MVILILAKTKGEFLIHPGGLEKVSWRKGYLMCILKMKKEKEEEEEEEGERSDWGPCPSFSAGSQT